MQKTNFAFEIIIGEDGSDDKTAEICENFRVEHPDKIRLFHRSREDVIYLHGKATGRFNVLQNLKQAKGRYIALLEGDDYWNDDLKLQKQFDFMEENKDCSLCHHSQLKLIDGKLVEDERFGQISNLSVSRASDLFSFRIQPQSRTMFFRNCLALEDLNGDFILNAIYGDFAFCFLLAKYGQIGYLKEDMAVYRVHNKGYAARSQNAKDDYLNSRLRLVEMWCQAKGFLDCDKESFKTGVMKIYSHGINRIKKNWVKHRSIRHWLRYGLLTGVFGSVLNKLIRFRIENNS